MNVSFCESEDFHGECVLRWGVWEIDSNTQTGFRLLYIYLFTRVRISTENGAMFKV